MKISYKIIYCCLVIYVIWILIIFPKWTVDDAYIIFRYASNWVKYGQLTWNVGEDPIEGYTGIALPMILGVLIKIGANPIITSQIIGILSFLIGGLLIYLLLNKENINKIICCSVILLYFTTPFFYTHSYSGLETMLFSTTIIACLYILLLCLHSTTKYYLVKISLLFCLLLFLGLIRPEGVILFFVSLFVLIFNIIKIHQKKYLFIILLLAGLLYFLPGILYFIWRWRYYGQFLPNTFYAKVSEYGFNRMSIKHFIKFLVFYTTLPAISIFILYTLHFNSIIKIIKQKILTPRFLISNITIIFILLVLFLYFRSNLMMHFSHRFFVPFFPILLINIAFILDIGLPFLLEFRKIKPLRFQIIVIILLTIFFGQLFMHFKWLKKEIVCTSDYKQLLSDEHIPTGLFIKENIPKSETLIVYLDAGATPFFAEFRTIDFGKLNDETLSKKNISNNDIVNYFYSFNAGVIVFCKHNSNIIDVLGSITHILNDQRFQQYEIIRTYNTKKSTISSLNNYQLLVYLRKDLVKKLKNNIYKSSL